jgi:hypothetical protein
VLYTITVAALDGEITPAKYVEANVDRTMSTVSWTALRLSRIRI